MRPQLFEETMNKAAIVLTKKAGSKILVLRNQIVRRLNRANEIVQGFYLFRVRFCRGTTTKGPVKDEPEQHLSDSAGSLSHVDPKTEDDK